VPALVGFRELILFITLLLTPELLPGFPFPLLLLPLPLSLLPVEPLLLLFLPPVVVVVLFQPSEGTVPDAAEVVVLLPPREGTLIDAVEDVDVLVAFPQVEIVSRGPTIVPLIVNQLVEQYWGSSSTLSSWRVPDGDRAIVETEV